MEILGNFGVYVGNHKIVVHVVDIPIVYLQKLLPICCVICCANCW